MSFSLPHLLAVAGGGAIGASLRYLVGVGALRLFGVGFPMGTLVVNLVGSFAMGLCATWLVERGAQEAWRLFLLTGIFGGFTTFSAFSLDAVSLWQKGAESSAVIYVLLSVVGSVLALYLGLKIARG